MYTEVDVFVSNYTLIDPEIYQLWIEGCSSSEAVSMLHQRAQAKHLTTSVELIASDVLDHYRTFALLERLLTMPTKLTNQVMFQLDEQTKHMLIEKYYDLDDTVIRELLGRKLSSRHRKDLDEVADRSGAPLRCCRRQFDNVRRVFKAVEETPGNVVQNIRNAFLLSEPLANLCCMRLKPKLLEKSYQELELNFRVYTRALVGLACNLHRGRELGKLFVDLLERCIEPLRLGMWPKTDLAQFLAAYEQCALQMDVLREADLKSVWERYMRVISQCLLTMYHT